MSQKIAIGIDFGTTYSCIGAWVNGGVVIIPNELFQKTTPSIVIFENKDKVYVGEETLSYLFGTRIDNKGGKDRMENIGSYLARGAEGVAASGVGYAGGIAALGLTKFLLPNKISFFGKTFNPGLAKKVGGLGRWGKIGALAALAGDVVWQMSR